MKKQVILLMTDTTRKDMLGCYGNSDMYTPNLDRLAAGGIRCCHGSKCKDDWTAFEPTSDSMWVYWKMAFGWRGLFWFWDLPGGVGT